MQVLKPRVPEFQLTDFSYILRTGARGCYCRGRVPLAILARLPDPSLAAHNYAISCMSVCGTT